MRNYRGISELSRKDFLDSLEFYDDEYFIILKRNRPIFVAFPSFVGSYLIREFWLSEKEITVTDLQRKNIPDMTDQSLLNIIRNNEVYYILVPYSPEIATAWAEHLSHVVVQEKSEYFWALKTQISLTDSVWSK